MSGLVIHEMLLVRGRAHRRLKNSRYLRRIYNQNQYSMSLLHNSFHNGPLTSVNRQPRFHTCPRHFPHSFLPP